MVKLKLVKNNCKIFGTCADFLGDIEKARIVLARLVYRIVFRETKKY